MPLALLYQVAVSVELLMPPGCRHSQHRDRPQAALEANEAFTRRDDFGTGVKQYE